MIASDRSGPAETHPSARQLWTDPISFPPSGSSSLVPPSILISSNPLFALRMFNHCEALKSQKQLHPRPSQPCGPSSSSFPSAAESSNLVIPPFSEIDLKRNRVVNSVLQTGPPSKRFRQTSHSAPSLAESHLDPFSSLKIPYPPDDSSSSDDHEERPDQSDSSSPAPAYPCLPPTPLTPCEVLQSSTLSRIFSPSNRTFFQISDSATGLVEADLGTRNRLAELVQVLRGDLTSHQWRNVLHNVARHPGPPSSIPAVSSSEAKPPALGFSESQDQPAPAPDGTSTLETSNLNTSPSLEYHVLAQSSQLIQSLFISPGPVTLWCETSSSEVPPRLSSSSETPQISKPSNEATFQALKFDSALPKTEALSPEKQIECFQSSLLELTKFLGDLTDYQDRLIELRDGCLSIEKRRKAMWWLMKICAKGFDELCDGGKESKPS